MPDQALWNTAGLFAALLMPATIAHAQTPAPPADILVTARPDPTVREIEQQAIAITRTGDMYRDPLARFSEPVCPGILGLPADVAGMMVDRIRYDAERVGAKVDPAARCKANILVVFVRDGAAEVRRMLKTSGFLLAGLEAAEAREIRNEPGPARAWNITALRTRFGELESPGLQRGPVQIIGPLSLGPTQVVAVPSSDSRIFLASRLDITSSVVVIDVAAIDRMSVDQVADYAAMRALARTRPARGDSAAATILGLFDSAGRHTPGMTRFDLAYLRSLYAAEGNLPAAVKIGGILPEYRKEAAQLLEVSAPRQ